MDNSTELMGDKMFCNVNDAGHFVLDLEVEMENDRNMHVFHVKSEFENFGNEMKLIKKLHHKFGHAKPHKLVRLIEHSNMFREMPKTKIGAIVDAVVDGCGVCLDEGTRDRRPKNSTLRAVEFNETVAIDLTEWWDEKEKRNYMSYDRRIFSPFFGANCSRQKSRNNHASFDEQVVLYLWHTQRTSPRQRWRIYEWKNAEFSKNPGNKD